MYTRLKCSISVLDHIVHRDRAAACLILRLNITECLQLAAMSVLPSILFLCARLRAVQSCSVTGGRSAYSKHWSIVCAWIGFPAVAVSGLLTQLQRFHEISGFSSSAEDPVWL